MLWKRHSTTTSAAPSKFVAPSYLEPSYLQAARTPLSNRSCRTVITIGAGSLAPAVKTSLDICLFPLGSPVSHPMRIPTHNLKRLNELHTNAAAGPLIIDGRSYFIPMATTEGVLVASTSRGSKAINAGGGAVTVITADGMTRGPCVGFGSIKRTGAAKLWLDSEDGQAIMRRAFNSTSRFARLQTMTSMLAGTSLFIRFKTSTGDAMGMNMISKGVEHALDVMKASGFEDMDIVTLTGNYCTDKKPSAMNWIQGRGKSVVAEAIIPADVVKDLLKTDVDSMVSIFVNKNMIGSAMAGSVGGFNAQAANIVAAIFIATGQDPAQVVESSNCITIMKKSVPGLELTLSLVSSNSQIQVALTNSDE